jgi:PEP-CTERM motif
MTPKKILIIVCFFLLYGGWGSITAQADPLLFSNLVALQNDGSTQIDLFSNPGVTLTGPSVSFLVNINGVLPPGTSQILLITYQEQGSAPQIISIPVPLGDTQFPFLQFFTINSPGATFGGVMGTLTLDIIGSAPDFVIPGGVHAGESTDSFTYSFNVAQPVPEPASVVMMVFGLAGLFGKVKSGICRKRN